MKIVQPPWLSWSLRVAFFLAAVIAGARHEVGAVEPPTPFEIQVLDDATGRGVPLVELITVDQVRHITDSAGRVAYAELDHVGETIYFEVSSQGYEPPKDGFGFPGVRLKIEPGGRAELRLKRTNIAERLYRITGRDPYRDSRLLGRDIPLQTDNRRGLVAGQDSVQAAVYRDRICWFWGDTNRLSYPLGLFRTAGATSSLPGAGGLAPETGIELNYFTGKDGFARAMVEVAEPKGVVWIDGVCVVPDDASRPRLVAHFSRREGLAKELEHGIVSYDDDRELFTVAATRPLDDQWRVPHNHPVLVTDADRQWLMFGNPYPVVRVPARLAPVLGSEAYESWSCLAEESDRAKPKPQRLPNGELDWRWRKGPPVTPKDEQQWLRDGTIRAEQCRFYPQDVQRPGRHVLLHSGTVRWNVFRQRWVAIAVETSFERDSPSLLGEVWYTEATAPQGPYRWAIRLVTHDKQSFYNPCHHDFLDADGGRTIFFEGTYCNTFTNSPATQRYNYNQIMYRLNLADERLTAAFASP